MIKLTLSASLARMLPPSVHSGNSARATLDVDVNDWAALVEDIGGRFTALADHTFDTSGRLRSGLLVAVNDEIVAGVSRRPVVKHGDDVYLFTQIAGG